MAYAQVRAPWSASSLHVGMARWGSVLQGSEFDGAVIFKSSDRPLSAVLQPASSAGSSDLKGATIFVCSTIWSWKTDVASFTQNDIIRWVQGGVPWQQLVARGANVSFIVPGDDATPHIDYATGEWVVEGISGTFVDLLDYRFVGWRLIR